MVMASALGPAMVMDLANHYRSAKARDSAYHYPSDSERATAKATDLAEQQCFLSRYEQAITHPLSAIQMPAGQTQQAHLPLTRARWGQG